MRLDHLLSKEHDLNDRSAVQAGRQLSASQLRHSLVRLFRFEEAVMALLLEGALSPGRVRRHGRGSTPAERLLRIA